MASEHFVLIVEDDFEIRSGLRELFSRKGFEVAVAANGAEAIELLQNGTRPCAAVIDLLMPGIVGQELLEYLRADAELVSIPVAIISGSPALAPEGYAVFPKPFDSRALVEFIRSRCACAHPTHGASV
jgi:CheY-like chemotaxis protein